MNPHNWISAVDPPNTPDRRWKCRYCDVSGTWDEVHAVACSYVYPPCDHCGKTPTCAIDCAGIWGILESPTVHVVGGLETVGDA